MIEASPKFILISFLTFYIDDLMISVCWKMDILTDFLQGLLLQVLVNLPFLSIILVCL